MRRTLAFILASSLFATNVARAQQPPPPQPQPYPPPGPYAQPYPQPAPQPYPPQPQPYPYAYPPPAYPPPPAQPPPPEEPKRWYGWQDLPGIGASIGLFFVARNADSQDGKVIWYTSAFLVGAVWAPAVHAFNGASQHKTKESFSLTTAGLAVGALVGVVVAASSKSDSNPDPDYGRITLNGMEVGVCVATVIDALLFAWTERKGPPEPDEAFVRPIVSFDGRRSIAGLGGTF